MIMGRDFHKKSCTPKALALEFLGEHPAVELIGKKSRW